MTVMYREKKNLIFVGHYVEYHIFLSFFLLLSTQIEESTDFVQTFDFLFLMDLQVLRCPDQESTISGKCLSVRLSVCLCACDKNFVASAAQEQT